MNILIVPSWFPTKENPVLGSFFLEQAQALSKEGHKITILYPEVIQIRHMKNWRGLSIDEEAHGEVTVYRKKLVNVIPQRYSKKRAELFKKGLADLLAFYEKRHGKAEMIHAHSWIWAGYAAVSLKDRYFYKVVVTEHSSKLLMNTYTPYEAEVYKQTISAADRIIAVGPALKERLEELSNKDVELIPNIVSDEFVDYPVRSRGNKTPTHFITVSFLTKNKQIDKIIESFAQRYRNKDAQLTIVGDGPEQQYLVGLVKNLNIADQVIFAGRVDRSSIPKLLNSADVYISASKVETFGVSIIEALAIGLPVIAYNSGGPALSVNSGNGILLENDEQKDFVNAFAKMEQIFTGLDSEMIRKDCLNRFGEKAIVQQLEKIYLK